MKSLRQTHTYVELPISQSAYMEIFKKLKNANYDHCFIPSDGLDYSIDMNGIALVIEKEKND